MNTSPVNIVWFKRDLRLKDHQPLTNAIEAGLPVLLMYCFEPSIIYYHDSDVRHWRFVYESLKDMQAQLAAFGKSMFVFHREAKDVFQALLRDFKVDTVFSHQETGNAKTYARDIFISELLMQHGVKWVESPSNGVVRRLKSRQHWEKKWQQRMTAPISNPDIEKLTICTMPESVYSSIKGEELPAEITTSNVNFQKGGEQMAHRYLDDFIQKRHVNYSRHISKPLESRTGCSRLSPYISYGNLSIRQVYQAAVNKYEAGGSKRDLKNFISRLHWHCHFIQKFEDECRIEFENHNRAYDSLIKPKNELYINSWQAGETGVPIVDACIKCLVQTGYISFRMRAMLVSFFVYNLWQDWRDLHFLARVFLDYEPGIHYPQLQMQASTTGINTIRIYNPIKNSEEHDPNGISIKKWLPALKDVPTKYIHQPWLMNEMEQTFCNCRLGVDYPYPIVDIEATRKYAGEVMWAFRKNAEVKINNEQILKKHVSRTSSTESKRQKKQVKA